MTLKFNNILEVVEAHVPTKFHQAICSGLWVIVYITEKRLSWKQHRLRFRGE